MAPGSRPARAMACLMACPPITAPWVSLKPPRTDCSKGRARGGDDDGLFHGNFLEIGATLAGESPRCQRPGCRPLMRAGARGYCVGTAFLAAWAG